MSTPYTRVGRVLATHGLNGEIAVAFDVPEYESAVLDRILWIVPPPADAPRSGRVSGVRRGPRGALVALDTLTSVEDARELRGRYLLTLSAGLPEGTLQPESLEGWEVVDATRGSLGTISETIVTGANDVWIVRGPFGEILIPVIDDVVISAEDKGRRINVRLLDGLLEDDGA
jgi:16S rRNA processing protein RimM